MIFLSACNNTAVAPSAKPELKPAPSPVPHVISKVKFIPSNANETETSIIKQGESIIANTVSSKCFKDFISKSNLVQTNRTPDQVAAHLETLSGTIKVHLYYRCMKFSWKCLAPTSAVAYRDPPHTDIYLNRAYFHTELDPIDWAATMAHEALGHSLGNYGHDFNATARRPSSVPYKIGEGIEKCATKTKNK